MILQHLKDLINNGLLDFESLSHFAREILLLESLHLEKLEPQLKALYASDGRGRKPKDPVKMLSALVLMNLQGEVSFSKWVKTTRTHLVMASLCGFTPEETPGVGTYYDFLDRLEDGPWKKRCVHDIRPSQLEAGPHLRNLKAEKFDEDQEGHKSAQLVEILLNQVEQPNPDDLQNRLQSYFHEIALEPSIKKGLIEPQKLDITGDGSTVVSGAAENGKPACECRKNQIYKCDCPKFYSDRTAQWGYDSYRKVFFFGHRFYQLCSSTNGHDLPLSITIEAANQSDYTLSLKTLDRFLKSCPEFQIHSCTLDAGHDSLAHYKYLQKKGILPVIALNPRTKPQAADKPLSQKGIPLCPAGVEMTFHARNKHQHRQIYHCPAKKKARAKGKSEGSQWTVVTELEKCPWGVLCQPESRLGPLVSISANENPRLFPLIGRGSGQYRKLMNLRSGVERSNAMKKTVYKLQESQFKRSSRFLIKLYLISMIEHATAWLGEDKKTTSLTEKEMLKALLKPG
jgi:hypothetical protein